MAEKKQFNLKNPAVKRILQEVKEMQRDPSKEYMSMPIEEDIFEWQFAIHGPQDTEFEGGVYHGRIILPAEYPFKPPAFMLLTPSGRFEILTKICLSISQHHPEHWQPSWSVRTALVALIAFLPTKPDGALGSLDYTKEERRVLAIKSREAPPKYGSPERQQIINQIHQQMLLSAPPIPSLKPTELTGEPIISEPEIDENPPNFIRISWETSDSVDNDHLNITNNNVAMGNMDLGPNPSNNQSPSLLPLETQIRPNSSNANDGASSSSASGVGVVGAEGEEEDKVSSILRNRTDNSLVLEAPVSPGLHGVKRDEVVSSVSPNTGTGVRRERQYSGDGGLTLLAIGLVVAILALLLRKFMKAFGDSGSHDVQEL